MNKRERHTYSRDITLSESQIMKQKEHMTKIKCKCGNPTEQICMDGQCQKYAFMCSDDQNDCKSYCHQKCLKISFKAFYQKLEIKVLDVSEIVKEHDKMVEKFIDAVIDEASKIKQLYKKYAEQHYRYCQMTEFQKQIWLKLQKNDVNDIKSSQIFLIFVQLRKIENNTKKFNSKVEQQKWIQEWNKIEQKLKSELSQIQLELFSQKMVAKPLNSMKFFKSSLIKTQEQKNIIQGFFDKNIKSVELLYKASENQFKLDNFYKNCTGIPNTLCIILTEFGKKIGGFTPLCWEKVQQQEQQLLADSTNSTFIFSLTNNQKLNQINTTDCGIQNYPNYGFGFGNQEYHNLDICDKANQNDSFACFYNGFTNQTYKQQNQQTLERFNGSPSCSERVKSKQWEVWKVVFEQ